MSRDVNDIHEARLTEERDRAVRLITKLTGDFDAVVEASTAVATDDEHDPEGATIAYERAQLDAVLSMTRAHLIELDHALARVRDGTYSICQTCGRPIGAERLDAQPATRSCVTCASPRTRRPLGNRPA
jgi:DnaK suppressor protein